MASDEALRTAAGWLERAYGGLVVPAGQPVIETAHAWLVPSAYADPTAPGALLAATVTVPKDGGDPYPASTADPLADLGADGWQWRVNARGCLVATDAAVGGHPASALPWHPQDERPGWWDRMLARYFPDAEVAECATWDEAASAIAGGGPGTHGALWLRRRVDGVEVTGHLLYAQHVNGIAVFIDGQRGELARLDDAEVGSLTLARFHRAPVPFAPPMAAAPDFPSATAKATAWLNAWHRGAVVLVDPDESDELRRGWLFACTSARHAATGDWRDQMLDAALVVPKAEGEEPFTLPNDDPWSYLRAWDAGATDLPEPPEPSGPDWFAATAGEAATSTHRTWTEAMAALSALPRALVWVRRADDRGRETVGTLLVAVRDADEVTLIAAHGGAAVIDPDPLAVHVIAVA
ncbi:YrhB domain-containing protein [Actinokineospora guangxiensis]|uniref:YrhB domain-containing protein n=1 Tax=Actinokineospora guangxiensis TaxID=1490288 RepID=A0ABW0ENJ0_9PSEU